VHCPVELSTVSLSTWGVLEALRCSRRGSAAFEFVSKDLSDDRCSRRSDDPRRFLAEHDKFKERVTTDLLRSESTRRETACIVIVTGVEGR
jgi:hypothetical protein